MDLYLHEAMTLPADLDVDAIAEDAEAAAFALIHARLERAGYPATGDVAPGEDSMIRGAFVAFTRAMAYNNNDIAALNDEEAKELELLARDLAHADAQQFDNLPYEAREHYRRAAEGK